MRTLLLAALVPLAACDTRESRYPGPGAHPEGLNPNVSLGEGDERGGQWRHDAAEGDRTHVSGGYPL